MAPTVGECRITEESAIHLSSGRYVVRKRGSSRHDGFHPPIRLKTHSGSDSLPVENSPDIQAHFLLEET